MSVFGRLAFEALAAGVDGGTERAAFIALRRTDPVLRPVVRARMKRALRDAWLEAAAEDPRQPLRLAALYVAGREAPADVGDPEAVRAAFERARASSGPARRSRWWATWAMALIAVGLIAVVVAQAAMAPVDPHATPVGRLLSRDLPRWVVALDRWGRDMQGGGDGAAQEGELREARALLESADARAALGEGAAAALVEVLDLAADLARVKNADRPAVDLFTSGVNRLNEALETAGHAYFVDGDVIRDNGGLTVLLYSFAVNKTLVLSSGGQDVRVLRVRRLDRLSYEAPYLGFTRESLKVALVLEDRIDEMVVRRVLPALAPNAPMPLADRETRERGVGWVEAVERQAGFVARDEIGVLEGLDSATAAELGGLLAERAEVLTRLRRTLRGKGQTMEDPSTIRTPDSLLRELSEVVSREDLRALERVSDRLDDERYDAVFDVVRAAVAESVDWHEAQHRLDMVDRDRKVPRALLDVTGVRDGEPPQWVRRAGDELSAYLAEIARDSKTTGLNLALVARFVLDSDAIGTPESYAAAVILEHLGEEVGIQTDRIGGGRAGAAELYLRLAALPRDRLKAAAATTHANLWL